MTLIQKNAQNAVLMQQPQYPKQPAVVVQNNDTLETEASENQSIGKQLNCGRVAIFIDGSNLFHAALHLGIEIDYTRLLSCLVADTQLLRAFFYTGADRTNEKQQGFLHWMRRNGYRVAAKDLTQYPDGFKKVNLSVEIAVDMLTLTDYIDAAILVSGDGDLTYAVNAITYKGVRVAVVGLRSMTSESLINVADCYIDLDLIKQTIQKPSNFSLYVAKSGGKKS